MKKQLLALGALAISMASYAADSEIISSTPEGTLHPYVYGASEMSFLTSGGGFGSFQNQGYCTSIVVNGDEIYVYNLIREYPGMDSWVKGTVNAEGVAEFTFPQDVALNGEQPLHVSMVKASGAAGSIVLGEATDDNVLRMTWDGTELVQILPDGGGRYDGMVGLFNAEGEFRSYGEIGLSYKVWNEEALTAPGDLELSEYHFAYNDQWNDPAYSFIYLGTDGNEAWIQGLCKYLPGAWVKGSVDADGNITIPSAQYLGIYNDYFIFFYGADNAGATGGKEYVWKDNAMLIPDANGGYTAATDMMINLGYTRPWFGYGMHDITMSEIAQGDRVPETPEWFEPEWDDSEGMGVGDFIMLPQDTDGQALNTSNLYFRLYFNGLLVEMETENEGEYTSDFRYGVDNDMIMYIGDHIHFVLFFEPLKSIGVQAVYKTGYSEQCSPVATYNFPTDGICDSVTANSEIVSTEYFNLMGARISQPSGLCIRRDIRADGTVESRKVNVIR